MPSTNPPLTDLSATERRAHVAAKIERDPSQMTLQLARDLGVPELEVVRALPPERAVELDITRWEQLVRSFETLGKVHVIVSNGSTTLEAFGQFGKFSTVGRYFNVQTSSLDMHICHDRLAAAFAVEKPGHLDSVNTLSFQFFSDDGSSAFKVFLTFGNKPPTEERAGQFADIRDHFRLSR
jgi:putative hemin transport protein